jgi:serine/threonine protein phosphatase PrpC
MQSSYVRIPDLAFPQKSIVAFALLRVRSPQRWLSLSARTLSRGDGREPQAGTITPVPNDSGSSDAKKLKLPFYFEAGYALFAKRTSRPFPPPFLSYPSGSFSDPLSTHDRSRDKRPAVNGELIRGVTNGDDAVLVSDYFIGVNDGVGAWAHRERGHAALWSRLILHFWVLEAEKDKYGSESTPKPVCYLQRAFEQTKAATSEPNEWQGTTTACAALLASDKTKESVRPLLYVTQLGDSKILVLRPSDRTIIYKTSEQWHWFDCPRQLGTNSPDTPKENAVMETVELEEGDVVLAMSDGVIDNLWDHEILDNVMDNMQRWQNGEAEQVKDKEPGELTYSDEMRFVAQELVKAARTIAEDPFAESPYMEKAVDEGLSIEGGNIVIIYLLALQVLTQRSGKLDDISVVVAQCKKRKV